MVLRSAIIAAVAVAAATGCGSTSQGNAARSASPDDCSGTASKAGVPYVLGDGTLYIDHRAQPGTWGGATSVGGYTIVARQRRSGFVALCDGKQVLSIDNAAGEPKLSANGKVAWLEQSGSRGTVVVRDLAQGRELGRLHVDIPQGEQGDTPLAEVVAVQDDGSAYYSLYYAIGDGSARDHVWKPGTEPTNGFPDDFSTDDPVATPGFPRDAVVRLSPDQLWGAWLVNARGAPLAEFHASHAARSLVVQRPGQPGTRYAIDVPAAANDEIVSWENLTTIRFINVEGPDFTCSTTSRTCSRAVKDFGN